MTFGDSLILWSIRAALLCYVAVLIGSLWLGPLAKLPANHAWLRASRWLWTIGCGLFFVHMFAALNYYHHWDWSHVLSDTAQQTEALIGMPFGEGIYFSFLFAGIWLVDVVAWWCWGNKYLRRPRALALGVHAYLFFIAFNGAIVFESGVTRWGGLVACVVLAILGLRLLRLRAAATESLSVRGSA